MRQTRLFSRCVLCVAALLWWCPAVMQAARPASDSVRYGTYVRNDATVYYGVWRGIRVTVDVSRGLAEPVISIANNDSSEFLFDPAGIVARSRYVADAPREIRRKIGVYPFVRADLPNLPTETHEVYTYREYQRRYGRSSFWEDVLTSVITSLPYGGDATADELIAYREREKQQESKVARAKYIDENYWRRNTIFPATAHVGFVSLRKMKADNLVLDIPVAGRVFHFEIIPSKILERTARTASR